VAANQVSRASASGSGTSAWPDPDDRNNAEAPKPDENDPPAPIPARSRDIIHTVKDGESFYGMALHYYRDGTKFLVIQEANPDIDPQLLSLGMKITIPNPDRVLAADAPRPAPAPNLRSGPSSGNTYVVKKGDSLWRIAKQTLGQGADFQKILDANRDLLGDNGDDLQPGMTLIIPR